MKLQVIIPALILATASTLSLNAYSATEMDKSVAAEPKPAEVKSDKPTAKKMKPHSHMEVKTGSAPAPKAAETAPAAADKAAMPEESKTPEADKARHLHPRDGK
jgi:hypothetical protein